MDIARAAGDVRGECDGLTGMARLALRQGDYSDVVHLARQARTKARQADDPAAEASPLHLEAAGVRLQGRYEDARGLYLESLALNERLGNEHAMTMEHHNLGWVDLHRGDVDAAEGWFRERDATTTADAYGDAWVQLNWAAVAAMRGAKDEAKHRFEAGKTALEKLAVTLDPDDQMELDWLAAKVEDA